MTFLGLIVGGIIQIQMARMQRQQSKANAAAIQDVRGDMAEVKVATMENTMQMRAIVQEKQ